MVEHAGTLIELLGFLAAFCTTTAFLPQAIKVLHTKDTRSLSLTMLSLQFTGTALWSVYGFLIHSPSLIVANILTTTLVGWIIVLKWYYEHYKREL